MASIDLQSYFDISQAPDKAALKRRMIDAAHRMDFSIANALLLVEHPEGDFDVTYLGNRPENYSPGTDKEVAKVDPVMTRLRRHGLPFVYDQRFYVDAGAPELWEVAAPYGYRTGISVGFRLSSHQRFLCGLDRERALPSNAQKVAGMLASLLMLAVHCQDAAQRLLAPKSDAPLVPSLSGRELEVLRWTMAGKTAWETGVILGISERTANLHIQAAARKLNCSNKHQAVLQALRMGLIS